VVERSNAGLTASLLVPIAPPSRVRLLLSDL
jgi:hypothetical protein